MIIVRNISPDREPKPKVAKLQPVVEAGCSDPQKECAEPVCSLSYQPHRSVYNTEEEGEIECAGCIARQTQNGILKNKIVSLHGQLGKRKAEKPEVSQESYKHVLCGSNKMLN